MTTPVQFGELPQKTHGESHGSLHAAAAAALRQRPHEWALIHSAETRGTASSTASHVRHGGLGCFRPAGTFEATVRGRDVWARYIGEST